MVPLNDQGDVRGSLAGHPDDHDVVEGGEPLGAHDRVQRGSRFELVVPVADGRERSRQVRNVDLSQEPERAEVDAQDGAG